MKSLARSFYAVGWWIYRDIGWLVINFYCLVFGAIVFPYYSFFTSGLIPPLGKLGIHIEFLVLPMENALYLSVACLLIGLMTSLSVLIAMIVEGLYNLCWQFIFVYRNWRNGFGLRFWW